MSHFSGRYVDRPFHGRCGIERNEENQQATLSCRNSDRRFFDSVVLARLGRGKDVSAVACALLAFISIRQRTRRSHPVCLFGNDCSVAGCCDSFRRPTGGVVHCRCRFVHFHRLAEHFLARTRQDGRLQKSGVVPAGDGRGWRRNPADNFRARCGCLEPSGFVHRSAGYLRLCRVLRDQRLQNRARQKYQKCD